MTTLDRLASALADRYQLERDLCQGGMATVYLAKGVSRVVEVVSLPLSLLPLQCTR